MNKMIEGFLGVPEEQKTEAKSSSHEQLNSPKEPLLSEKMEKFAQGLPPEKQAEFLLLINEAKQVEKNERTDTLTGLRNRFGFTERLEEEQARHEDHKKYSVIVLDLDGFKAINDTFGHDAGDKCLQLIAEKVGGVMPRHSDVFARVGGDEFRILLPNTDEAGAGAVAERVFTAIDKEVTATLKELYPGSAGVSASIGIVSYEDEVTTDIKQEDVLKLADYASYVVKAAGKRGVVTLDYARKELDTNGVLWNQFVAGVPLPR